MKNNIFRLIFWFILFLMFVFLGVLGLSLNIKNNSLTEDEKNTIHNIANIYNDSNYVKSLKAGNILTSASLKNRKLIVTYSDQIIDTKYVYEYSNGELKISFSNSDKNAWFITKLLVDSVAISKGLAETSTFNTFENIKLNNAYNDPGIILSIIDNNVDIIFNVTEVIIIPSETTFIDNNTLSENAEKIKAFDYEYSSSEIALHLSKENSSNIIKITSKEPFDQRFYVLLVNVLNIIYDDEFVAEFMNSYPEISTAEVKEFAKYKIENKTENDVYTLTVYITNENSQE